MFSPGLGQLMNLIVNFISLQLSIYKLTIELINFNLTS